MKLIGVGSSNPVKIKAVEQAIEGQLSGVTITGKEVSSKVSAQPISDEETRTGAYERAMAIRRLLDADVGVGLEGGVFVENGKVWNTVWCVVVDRQGRVEMVNGSRFVLPERLSVELLKGREMGHAMDALTGIKEVHKKMGMLGVVSDGWVDRASEYAHLVKLAMGRLLSEWK